MFIVYYAILFIFGGLLGSFLAVVADRYNTSLNWWQGRSKCFYCNSSLKILDLIPFFSFLFLKGRCRYCNLKIPINLFLIELSMSVLSIVAGYKTGIVSLFSIGLFYEYLLLCGIFAIILLIAIYDIKHFIIPNSFLILLLVLSLIYSNNFIWFGLVSGLTLPLPFLFLFWISKGKWLGFGDIKYMAVIGVLLGLPLALSAVVSAFWIGAIYSVFLLLVFKKNLTMKSMLPFGPFLSLGIVLSFLLEFDLFKINDLIYFLSL